MKHVDHCSAVRETIVAIGAAHVGNIRGRGLFMAVELVEDRSSKTPFDPKLKLNARIKREATARGLMVYPSGIRL